VTHLLPPGPTTFWAFVTVSVPYASARAIAAPADLIHRVGAGLVDRRERDGVDLLGRRRRDRDVVDARHCRRITPISALEGTAAAAGHVHPGAVDRRNRRPSSRSPNSSRQSSGAVARGTRGCWRPRVADRVEDRIVCVVEFGGRSASSVGDDVCRRPRRRTPRRNSERDVALRPDSIDDLALTSSSGPSSTPASRSKKARRSAGERSATVRTSIRALGAAVGQKGVPTLLTPTGGSQSRPASRARPARPTARRRRRELAPKALRRPRRARDKAGRAADDEREENQPERGECEADKPGSVHDAPGQSDWAIPGPCDPCSRCSRAASKPPHIS